MIEVWSHPNCRSNIARPIPAANNKITSAPARIMGIFFSHSPIQFLSVSMNDKGASRYYNNYVIQEDSI